MANTIKTSEESSAKSKLYALYLPHDEAGTVDRLKKMSQDTAMPVVALVSLAIKQFLDAQVTCCGTVYDASKKFCHQCGKTLKPTAKVKG